jgi:hypothetical protein
MILTGAGTQSQRLAWQDDEGGTLEQKLRDIAVEVIVSGELQYREECEWKYKWRVTRKAQLEEELRRRKAEAERRVRERRIQLEKERIDRLLSESALLRQANDIRDYVKSVRAIALSQSSTSAEGVKQWCNWALREANRIDPIRSGAYLKNVSGGATENLGDPRGPNGDHHESYREGTLLPG